jgi:methylmalonyl-CoA/ethylmalonyl-CoA epimerase
VIEKLNHVGIAVKDLEKTIASFEQVFGAKLVSKTAYKDEKFMSALMTIGEAHFEILASSEPGSMIDKFIEDRSEGIHHLSLQVENFDEVIKDFKVKGLKVIGEVNMPGFKAAFIHPANNFGMLMEIVEPKG